MNEYTVIDLAYDNHMPAEKFGPVVVQIADKTGRCNVISCGTIGISVDDVICTSRTAPEDVPKLRRFSPTEVESYITEAYQSYRKANPDTTDEVFVYVFRNIGRTNLKVFASTHACTIYTQIAIRSRISGGPRHVVQHPLEEQIDEQQAAECEQSNEATKGCEVTYCEFSLGHASLLGWG